MASSLASSSIFLISMALASSWVMPEIFSSSSRPFRTASAILASSTSRSFSFWVSLRSFWEKSLSLRSIDWNRRSRFSSLLRSRRSVSLILRCFSRFRVSNSFRRARSFSRATMSASRLIFSPSSRARSRMTLACSSASAALRVPSCRLSSRTTTAAASPTMMTMPAIMTGFIGITSSSIQMRRREGKSGGVRCPCRERPGRRARRGGTARHKGDLSASVYVFSSAKR